MQTGEIWQGDLSPSSSPVKIVIVRTVPFQVVIQWPSGLIERYDVAESSFNKENNTLGGMKITRTREINANN